MARAIRSKGTIRAGLGQKGARVALEEKTASARQRTFAREFEWVRASPKARQAKSKARIQAYDKMQAEADTNRDHDQKIGNRHPAGRGSATR